MTDATPSADPGLMESITAAITKHLPEGQVSAVRDSSPRC